MGVSVFRGSELQPFQTLPDCGALQFPDHLNENWFDAEISEVLLHADLNFDGFEDLELLQYYIPHLDKRLYCIYLWDKETGRFSYSKDLTEIAVNLEPHPENKTLTAHEDWFGGVYADRTYHWIGAKLELIEERGRLYGSSDPKCGFTDHCEELVNGKMITTLERPATCTNDKGEDLDDIERICPTAATPPTPKAPAKK